MINIEVNQRSGDVTISIKGHANYDSHGKDIVCAGVSAIVQTSILGLEAIAESYPNHVKIDIKNEQ